MKPETLIEFQSIEQIADDLICQGIKDLSGTINWTSSSIRRITGVRTYKTGSLFFGDHDASRLSIGERKNLGLAYIPSDRMRSGALMGSSIMENFLLGYQNTRRYNNHGFVNYSALREDSLAFSKDFEIKLVSLEQKFSDLSGGNQQKVVLAREVSKRSRFVLASQPIRGLDIGATEYVHKTLLKLRKEGRGILLISAELSELLNLCDRIIVLCNGEITGEFERKDFDEKRIGLWFSCNPCCPSPCNHSFPL